MKALLFFLITLPLQSPAFGEEGEPDKLDDHSLSIQDGSDASPKPIVDPDFLVREAVRRLRVGDHIGAQIQLELALEHILKKSSIAPDAEPWLKGDFSATATLSQIHHRDLNEVLYLYAGTLHEKGEILQAISIYESLLAHFSNNHRKMDIQYRLATALSKSGQHQEAIKSLRHIGPKSILRRIDRRKIRVMKRTFKFRRMPATRRARKLDKRMRKAKPEEFPYDRARIRTELVQFYHSEMESYPFKGSENEIVRNHAKREALHILTVKQLERAILLKQPQWVSRMLTMIGENLMLTGDELLSSPTPISLDVSLHEIYRTEIKKYATATWMKAHRYITEGLHLSTRLGLAEDIQKKLASLKEAIRSRIEKS